MKVCNWPSIEGQRAGWRAGHGGGPVGHQVAKAKYLGRLGWETLIPERLSEADVLHVHGPIDARLPDLPSVLTIHAVWPVDVYPEHPAFWEQQNAQQAALMRQATVTVALSNYTANRCRALAPECDVRMIPQAWDHELWPAGGRTEPPGDPPRVLWGKAGAGPLLDPTPVIELAWRFPQAAFLLTAPRADVERMTGTTPVNVRCVGPQTYDAMRALVTSCDVLLATCLEASGQLTLEALGMGLPVVGYAWGGTGETVLHGKTGFLASPGDVNWLAEGLRYVLENREQLGRAARRTAQRWYTWAEIAPQWAALYEELIERKGAG